MSEVLRIACIRNCERRAPHYAPVPGVLSLRTVLPDLLARFFPGRATLEGAKRLGGHVTDIEWVAVVPGDESVGNVLRVKFSLIGETASDAEGLGSIVGDRPSGLTMDSRVDMGRTSR